MRNRLCYRVLLRFEGKYPLGEMCRILGISYSGYYKWRKRQQQPDRDETLAEMIKQRFKSSNNSAGYRQITMQLKTHYGLVVNHKTVYRIMRKIGLQSVSRRPRPYTHYSDAIPDMKMC